MPRLISEFHPKMYRIFLLVFKLFLRCSTYSNTYLIIRILNVQSQMITTLQAKQLSIYLSSQIFFYLRQIFFYSSSFEKSQDCEIDCLLLQFLIGSQDSDVITSYIHMFAYKGNGVWNKQWKIDNFCFFLDI